MRKANTDDILDSIYRFINHRRVSVIRRRRKSRLRSDNPLYTIRTRWYSGYSLCGFSSSSKELDILAKKAVKDGLLDYDFKTYRHTLTLKGYDRAKANAAKRNSPLYKRILKSQPSMCVITMVAIVVVYYFGYAFL